MFQPPHGISIHPGNPRPRPCGRRAFRRVAHVTVPSDVRHLADGRTRAACEPVAADEVAFGREAVDGGGVVFVRGCVEGLFYGPHDPQPLFFGRAFFGLWRLYKTNLNEAKI